MNYFQDKKYIQKENGGFSSFFDKISIFSDKNGVSSSTQIKNYNFFMKLVGGAKILNTGIEVVI